MKRKKETKSRKACASPQIHSINMKGTYQCVLSALFSASLAFLPCAQRELAGILWLPWEIWGGDKSVDNVFFRGRGWQEEWNRGRGVWEAGELLEFEGHHFRSINVGHSALLSDIIKRLSPHSGRQPISHSVCRHLFFSKRATEKKKHLFVMRLCCLCMNLPGQLAELHYLFTLLSQGTAAKNVQKKTKLNMSSLQIFSMFLPNR